MRESVPPISRNDREFIRATLILGTLAFVAATAVFVATIKLSAPIPRDATTLVLGRDFLDFWINGHAAWASDPGQLYDPRALAKALSVLVGPHYLGQSWAYPPGVLLLAAPFGLLGYLPALFCWTLLGICVFVWSALRYIPNRAAAFAVIVSPASMLCLMSGQASFLIASLFFAVFALLDRRPLLAGLLIGMASLKPQLGLLFPVMLIASGRWRTLFAAAISTIMIGALSGAIWGPQIWLDYLHHGIPTGNLILADPNLVVAPFMPTIFMNLRLAGASYSLAMTLQSALCVLAAAALIWACRVRDRADNALLFALFLGCSLCAVPYMLSYDTLPLVAAGMMLLASGKLDALGSRLVQLVYWLPLIQIGFGAHHLAGPAAIGVAFTVYVLVRLVKRERTQPETETSPLAMSAGG